MYLDAALGVVRYFGHSEALDKTWFPWQHGCMPFLGIAFDCERERLILTDDKRRWYAETSWRCAQR